MHSGTGQLYKLRRSSVLTLGWWKAELVKAGEVEFQDMLRQSCLAVGRTQFSSQTSTTSERQAPASPTVAHRWLHDQSSGLVSELKAAMLEVDEQQVKQRAALRD